MNDNSHNGGLIVKRFLFIAFISMFFYSCASTIKDGDFKLEEGEGILVSNISSDTMEKFMLHISGGDGSFVPSITIKKGKPLLILKLKEGEYWFNHLVVGGFWSVTAEANLHRAPTLKVEAGKVNYVGDLKYEKDIATINTNYFDNEKQTMIDAYTQLPELKDYEFVSNFY